MPTAGSAASKCSAATARSSASCRAAPPALRSGPAPAAASALRRCRFPGRKPSATAPSCARRSRRAPSAARSISSAPRSSSSAIRCGLINSTRSGRASCRDASSGLDCNSNGLSCGPCPADSRYHRPDNGRHHNNNPARGRRSSNLARPRRPAAAGRTADVSSSQAWCRPAADRTRRHCSNARRTANPATATRRGPARRSTECADVAAAAGARPTLQRQPGALPGPQRAPAGQRKPAKKNESR